MLKKYHPVLEILKSRYKSDSENYNDGNRLCIAVEGGGMRGVVSAGMLMGLESLGLKKCFDSIIGASAGALNSAYFVSGQSSYGITSYYQKEGVGSDKFIDNVFRSAYRVIANKPVINLDYLYESVVEKNRKLNFNKLKNSKIELNITVASLRKREVVVLNKFSSKNDVIKALRATTGIPIISNSPVEIDNELYWDPFIYEPIPIFSAIKQGFTHILVLRTRTANDIPTKFTLTEKYLMYPRILKKYGKGLADDYMNSIDKYQTIIEFLENKQKEHSAPPYVYTINAPNGIVLPNQLERSSKILIDGAKAGVSAVFETMVGKKPKFTEVLYPTISSYHPEHVLESMLE